MSPEPTHDQDNANEAAAAPGARLKAKREAGGHSLEDVSRDTRITCSRLIALEQDDYPRVGTHTFVVGYIRKYAKWLHMDADELVRAYEQAIGYEPPQDLHTASSASQSNSRASRQSRRLPLVWVVAAILAVWIAASFLLPSDDQSVPATSDRSPAEEPSIDQPPAVDEVNGNGFGVGDTTEGEVRDDAALDSAGSAGEGAAGSADNGDSAAFTTDTNRAGGGLEDTAEPDATARVPEAEQTTAPAAGAEPPAAEAPIAGGEFAETSPAAPAEADDTLTMSFSGDCWVEVRDANGDVLFTRLQQAGDNLRLSGEAPFAIMLGNARVADVQVNGRPVDTNPGPNRDTMRLTVGP